MFSLEITVEKAYQLGIQFLPQGLVECCNLAGDSWCRYSNFEEATFGIRSDMESGYKPDGKERYGSPAVFKYIVFKMPDDENDYLLIVWHDCLGGAFWVLLKTNDGGETFQKVCENEKKSGFGFVWCIRLVDLTGDNIPELLFENALAGSEAWEGLRIFQWQNGCFKNIKELGPNEYDKFEPAFTSTSYITIEDINEDRVAEIIQGPHIVRIYHNEDETEETDITWEAVNNGEVWHFKNGLYRLYYEFAPTEENHIYVPSTGVFHPSTVPLYELSNPGNGKIKLFVSDPAGVLSAENFKTDSFKYGSLPLSFKKIWKNKNYPDESFANYAFMDVPVRQILRQNQGEWQTNPSDPFILSPNKMTEYHFIGDYVELEMKRKELFPYLLKKAQEHFSKNPESTTAFVSISLRAKFDNGKIANIIAIIAVKK